MLRETLTEYLAGNGIEDPTIRQIVLCADEALINAIEHGGRTRIVVSARVHRNELSVSVADGGRGFDPSHIDLDSRPDLLREHGRGLFLINRLMDEVEILSGSRGTTLRMRLDLSGFEHGRPSPKLLPSAA